VSWWLLPVVLLYSLLQLLLGIAIGMWLKDRKSAAARAVEDRNRDLLARLNDLANNMALDVGEHSHRIEQISSHLMPVADPPIEPASDSVIIETIEQIVSANQQLCDKLATAEQQLHQQAEQINCHLAEARIDALTAMPNRRQLDSELARRFAEWQRTANMFSLAMLDIDHFKRINDRYGHQAGDQILHDVAARLADTMRDMDLVARYGGEEFAIILASTSFEDAKTAAERARIAIERAPFEYEGHTIVVTVSLGVSDVAACDSPAAMIKRADAALYCAKQAGRNRSYANDGRVCSPVVSVERKLAAKKEEADSEAKPAEPSINGPVDALTDWVTGLPNRRAFSDQLRTQINSAHVRSEPLSLLVISVEGFADCAAVHGQAAVEASLRTIAEAIQSAVPVDDLVTRYGWDGFAVILSGADLTATHAVASNVATALSTLPSGSTTMSGIQLKLGMAALEPEDDVVSLAKRADAAVQECAATWEGAIGLSGVGL
jgi:diguanylate cyclase